MNKAPLTAIPVHLITGFLGAGKSTVIQGMLAQKPAAERWAILVNEFGQVGIDQALFDERDDVVVKGLPGGCLCCQLAFVLQATLVNLLHRHRPDRLIIEPSGLGHPAGVLELLRGEAFREVLELHHVITVLDPTRLGEARVNEHPTFRDQLEMADGVVIAKADLATAEQLDAAHALARDHWPLRRWVIEVAHGAFPIALLLQPHAEPAWQARVGHENTAHHQLRAQASKVVMLEDWAPAMPQPGSPTFEQGAALGYTTLGWRWSPYEVFDLDRLTLLLGSLPAGLRIKGVLHTDSSWVRYNRGGSAACLEPSAWRQDSRLEVIGEDGTIPDAHWLAEALQQCVVEQP